MFDYAIVEISGRQYKVVPGANLEVDFVGDVKSVECDKVLLISKGAEIQVGTPFLKEKLVFDVIETAKKPKVRVATYKSKANTRKVTGQRRVVSRLKLQEKATKSA